MARLVIILKACLTRALTLIFLLLKKIKASKVARESDIMTTFNRHAKPRAPRKSISTALAKILPGEDEETIDGFVVDEGASKGGEPANANIQGSQANAIEYFAGEILYKAYKSVVKDQKDPLLLTLGEVASKVAGNNNTSRSYLGKGFAVLAAYTLLDYHLRKKK
jgi:hypothetical protein